jgi:hypothetical protein
LLTAFARGARHRVFFEKIENIFADGLCQGLSAQVFFQKKIKTRLFADGPASRPSAKKVSKNRQSKPLLTATSFGRRPAVGSRHSLCREPRARVLGKEPWPRKKFSVRPVPSATVGKAFADGLLAFAESFRFSAKPGFPVVQGSIVLLSSR